MMDNLLTLLMSYIGTFFIVIFFIYCWKNLIETKKTTLSARDFLVCVIITFFTSCALVYIKIYPIKIVLNVIILVTFNYYLYYKDIKKSFIVIILLQILIMISEVIYAIIINTFGIDFDNYYPYSELINGLLITLISILIWREKHLQKFYHNIFDLTSHFKSNNIVLSTLLMLVVAIISTMAVYLKWNYVIVLTINTLIILFFIFASIKFANAQNKYNEISGKYETSISSLKEYESMIDKYRIYNHENKNELLTLRNLISKKNTKALNYINGILNDKIKDNEKIMYKTSKIPEGGLRAIIYSKLCKMDELDIKYSIDIAKDVRTVDLINMNEEIVLNICKILGVFLDNAIEAVKDIKRKQIEIEIYLMDECLCIDISNNYEGKFDANRIDYAKYTTKGNNHGYGLSLVKQIIDDNQNIFENEKLISKNTFTQKLKIKM